MQESEPKYWRGNPYWRHTIEIAANNIVWVTALDIRPHHLSQDSHANAATLYELGKAIEWEKEIRRELEGQNQESNQ